MNDKSNIKYWEDKIRTAKRQLDITRSQIAELQSSNSIKPPKPITLFSLQIKEEELKERLEYFKNQLKSYKETHIEECYENL